MILVTGASGFIGQHLLRGLEACGMPARASIRSGYQGSRLEGVSYLTVGDLDGQTDWSRCLEGVRVVIHAAARAHPMSRGCLYTVSDYRDVNVQGTVNLYRQAVSSGVKRFVFVSSIGVNGRFTTKSHKFASDSAPSPVGEYARSKWEAELALFQLAAHSDVELVVVRSPLVYGPGVRGNFERLLRLVKSGVPLPFAAVDNKRSFIGIDNLVSLLLRCVDHNNAAGRTFLVSDGQDLSTPDLVRMISNSMGRPSRLFPFPLSLLRLAGAALGQLAEMDRMLGSLQVDSRATRELLEWVPLIGVDEGVDRMVRGYMAEVGGT